MTEDEEGLQRAEEAEASVKELLAARIDEQREWLEEQLGDQSSLAELLQRDLNVLAESRSALQAELKDSNPEPIYTEGDLLSPQRPGGQNPWPVVIGFFAATLLFLYGTGQKFDESLLPLVFIADAVLLVFGFLVATPLWSPAPKPPALMPSRPLLPSVKEPEPESPSGTWRNRLENAQGRLAKLRSGDQSPQSSAHLQKVLVEARADLDRFIADAKHYLHNSETDYLGWIGVAWPGWVRSFRLAGLGLVPASLALLGITFGGLGALHGLIAIGGGLAAGFFRGSNLSFVEPPEPE